MSRIAAVLLAAGESRRMGSLNKLTVQVDGMALVRRSASVLLASRVAHVLVVLGHEADTVAELLLGLPLDLTRNMDYREGQMRSVSHGLAQLGGDYDGVLIALADQPRLAPADIDALIQAFEQRGGHSIVVPTVDGQRGNPILLDWRQREAILADGRNLGCRKLIRDRPDEVLSVPMQSRHYVQDLDTREDLQRFRAGPEDPATSPSTRAQKLETNP